MNAGPGVVALGDPYRGTHCVSTGMLGYSFAALVQSACTFCHWYWLFSCWYGATCGAGTKPKTGERGAVGAENKG